MLEQPSRDDTKALAEFWGVGQRTMQNYLNPEKNGGEMFWVPNTLEFAQRILRKPKVKREAKLKAQQILMEASNGEVDGRNAAWPPAEKEEGTLRRPEIPATIEEAETEMSLEAYAGLVSRQLQAAYDNKDPLMIQQLRDDFLKVNEALMKQKLHMQKLGLDNLETIDRPTLTKLFYILFWSMVRGIDSITSRTANVSVNKDFPEEIYNEVHPMLMDARFAIPVLQMTAYAKSIGVPEFVKEVFLDLFSEFHDRGAEAFKDCEQVLGDLLKEYS